MIFFGTKGVTSTSETGTFNCPTCSSAQEYSLKRVRRFFTLYFIPLIPLDSLGEYVECSTCKDTYKPNILDYDPEANSQKFQAEYYAAITLVMINVLLADGVIEESEIKTIQEIYNKITGHDIDRRNLDEEIAHVEKNKTDFATMLANLQGVLNDEGKEMVVRAAIYVAWADGQVQEEEKVIISKIGARLGMTPAHLSGVIESA